jgi:hypothetical protein
VGIPTSVIRALRSVFRGLNSAAKYRFLHHSNRCFDSATRIQVNHSSHSLLRAVFRLGAPFFRGLSTICGYVIITLPPQQIGCEHATACRRRCMRTDLHLRTNDPTSMYMASASSIRPTRSSPSTWQLLLDDSISPRKRKKASNAASQVNLRCLAKC